MLPARSALCPPTLLDATRDAEPLLRRAAALGVHPTVQAGGGGAPGAVATPANGDNGSHGANGSSNGSGGGSAPPQTWLAVLRELPK